ncbi:replication initiation factor domain-containing protein [Photobacterium indicum]|uniref:replication initiation factor domain-containing protein n=1 Tax=Photobacterium indicum TaxID=81447 RepID=UPI003D0D75E3
MAVLDKSTKSPQHGRNVFVDWLRFSAPLSSLSELHRAGHHGIGFDDNMAVIKLPKPDYNMYSGEARARRIDLYQERYHAALITRLRQFCWLVLGFNCSVFVGGKNGYTNGFKLLTPDGLSAGSVSFGGNNDTFCVDVSGVGSAYLFDNVRREFHDARELTPKILHFWLSDVLNISRLKRLDLAIDFRDGALAVDDARKAYDGFSFRRSTGKYPSFMDFKKGDVDGSLLGDTFYCGSRNSAVMWRVYNKALQLNILTDWIRAEVQLNDVHIDVLLDIDGYYSGLCEFSSSICSAKPKKLPSFDSVKKSVGHILSKTNWLRHQCSNTLHGLLEHFQGDLSAVFGLIMRQDDIDDLVINEVLDKFSVSPTTLKLNDFINSY